MNNSIDSIERELIFSANIQRVWDAITQPEQVRQWFGSDAQYQMEIGAEGFFEWKDECEGRFAIRIEAIEAPHYFAWRWMLDADVPFNTEGSTLVEWRLSETSDGKTRLVMLETGFATAKHHQMNTEGWQQELADLEAFLAI